MTWQLDAILRVWTHVRVQSRSSTNQSVSARLANAFHWNHQVQRMFVS
ncbi:hypothetical protein PUN4_280272 [Paraburkholderia unamae]|nr:hypothetical protein PUN4_280272 [Paraburkholderia unamae]